MCGIAGIWKRNHQGDPPENVARAMTAALAHRGPDAAGIYSDRELGLALGHRRLSILDLSEAGCQPMTSRSGRYVIVYNGEVYNFRELRQELQCLRPLNYLGASDTEVILHAVDAWGVHAAVARFIGMFAFALWDRKETKLHLVRDRVGIKPLYFGRVQGDSVFASELKSFRQIPGFDNALDTRAIALFMQRNCIPAPYSIYQGIQKVAPGTVMTVCADHTTTQRQFWSPEAVIESALANPFGGTPEEGIDELESLIADSVRMRMVADVPVGAFLSGGIDSSTVAALMQKQSSQRVRTFSIGSTDPQYNEAPHAKVVADHLGTEHRELYITPEMVLNLVPRMPVIYDEPFADASQIPTCLVSELTSHHVSVSLSGDGGDELFAGYNRHVWGKRVLDFNRRTPKMVQSAIKSSLTALSPDTWDSIARWVSPLLPNSLKHRTPGYKLQKLAGLIGLRDVATLHSQMMTHWNSEAIMTNMPSDSTALLRTSTADLETTNLLLLLDLVTYLPDDILTKVDRASMAVSLEARVPLLDHRIIEFAWRLPLKWKLADGRSKWILRQVLARYVAPALTDRPKTGFGFPLANWLRGPLRPWAEALLTEHALSVHGFFDTALIRKYWGEHLRGRRSLEYQLWDVLMFQAWYQAVHAGLDSPITSELKTA